MKYVTLEELEDKFIGEIGTPEREEYEFTLSMEILGEKIKQIRKENNMTQEELAEKTGTRKSFISRIENGHSDIQLSTLFKLIEIGLGKEINLTITG